MAPNQKKKKKKKKVRHIGKRVHLLPRKVEQMEKERKQDRSWTGKELLQRHKKIKLAIKDAIEDVKKTLGLNRP